jgi:hypothetical protein
MKRFLLLFFFACCLLGRPVFASDQKLAHGAGTLPHLTSAVTLSGGGEIPTPVFYALRYDIGLGNRVQLGIAASVIGYINSAEIHSMFNVFKTAHDSNFISLYLNPGILNVMDDTTYFGFRTGVAYEHRFGNQRHIGLYAKVGVLAVVAEISDNKVTWINSTDMISLDLRAGFQALLGNHFSIGLEPMLLVMGPLISEPAFGAKVALTWAL